MSWLKQATFFVVPKHTLSNKQDEDAKASARLASEELKKRPLTVKSRLFFMDETTLSLHPPLAKCWMQRGEQKCIPTPGQQESCHVFGAWDWHQDEIVWTIAAAKNSEAFIAFIEYLLLGTLPR